MSADQKPFDAKSFFIGMVYFFILIPCGGLVVAAFNFLISNSQFTPPKAPGIIGQKGVIISDMIGCPNLNNLKTLIKEFYLAENANDKVGIDDVLDASLSDGCRSLITGQSGLVIDMDGYYAGWTKLRLDDDQETYWIDNHFVGTDTAPNWDVRRWFWDLPNLIPAKIRIALQTN